MKFDNWQLAVIFSCSYIFQHGEGREAFARAIDPQVNSADLDILNRFMYCFIKLRQYDQKLS